MRFVLNLSKGLVLEKNLTSSRMQLQYMWEWFATEYALSIEALAALGEDTLTHFHFLQQALVHLPKQWGLKRTPDDDTGVVLVA